MKPLISVVIPVFNRPKELRRALESLLAQTRKDFEVIVCDDGSTDDVASVATAFRGALNLTYLRIENSGGPARPRNVACASARADWISFLDSDDWWSPERIESVSAELKPGVDLVYHRLRVDRGGSRLRHQERRSVIGEPVIGDPLRYMALFGNPIPNSAAIVRRSMLEQIGGISEDKSLVVGEDFDAWLRLIEIGVKPIFLDMVLGFYWLAPDSISTGVEKQLAGQRAVFDRHVAMFGSDWEALARSCQAYRVGSLLMRMPGREREAMEELRQANDLPRLRMRLFRAAKLAICATPLCRLVQLT